MCACACARENIVYDDSVHTLSRWSRRALPLVRPAAWLAELLKLLIDWPQLQELLAAVDSNPFGCHNRRRRAATSLAACARAEMTAALYGLDRSIIR